MNVTVTICLVVFFSFIGEVLTWIVRKDNTFKFGYVAAIRILAICLSICTIYSIKDEYNNYNSLQEANLFKYELLQHQDSLINYQRNMIKELANYLQNEHNCNIPQFDGKLKDNIQFEEEYLDSLYNTQL